MKRSLRASGSEIEEMRGVAAKIPLVVAAEPGASLEQDRADETNDRILDGEDGRDLQAAAPRRRLPLLLVSRHDTYWL